MKGIDNTADILNSRDIIARIAELQEQGKRDKVEQGELDTLVALAEEASPNAPDWTLGEILIRDSYFVDYARDFAEDIGAVDRKARWPLGCLDWDLAAQQLQVDYAAVDFGGVTYWIR